MKKCPICNSSRFKKNYYALPEIRFDCLRCGYSLRIEPEAQRRKPVWQ